MKRSNRRGERTEPWAVPVSIVTRAVCLPSTSTDMDDLLYRSLSR